MWKYFVIYGKPSNTCVITVVFVVAAAVKMLTALLQPIIQLPAMDRSPSTFYGYDKHKVSDFEPAIVIQMKIINKDNGD